MASREDWRAKYAFLDEEVAAMPSTNTNTDTNGDSEGQQQQQQQPLRRGPPPGSSSSSFSATTSSSSSRFDDTLYELERTLERLEGELVVLNNGKKIQLSSYKQVSLMLFGTPDQSTSKQVLEGMAASNGVAKLLLEHRQANQQYTKLQKKVLLKDKKVTSVTQPRRRTVVTMTTNSNNSNEEEETSSTSTTTTTMVDSEPLLLVDTSSFVYRAYYSMPPMHRASDGMPVGAVLGFCNMLNRLVLNAMLRGEQPRLVLCCDAFGPTFRHELYKDYKAHRTEAPMDLIPQFEFIKQAANAYGMLQIEAKGYEADDVIATLSHRAAFDSDVCVDILSSDKDLMQLINDVSENADDDNDSTSTTSRSNAATIEMIDPMTMTRVTHETVVEKWGVPSRQLGDVLALAGDQADNIPGVPGIGPKIAAKLVQEFGTLEALLSQTDQLPPGQKKRRENLETFADQARMSQRLVALETNIPWERLEMDPISSQQQTVAAFRMEPMNADRILAFYDEMGFYTIKQRLLERLEQQERIQYQQQQQRESKPKVSVSNTNPKPVAIPKKQMAIPKKQVAIPRKQVASIPKGMPNPDDYKDVPF
jgi:DNA polymerase-1